MSGGSVGSQPYVFSRKWLYLIIPNFATGGMSTVQTACDKGLVSRRAHCVANGMIAFVHTNGISLASTSGQVQSITDAKLWPLFNGIQVEDYYPVDYNYPESMHLEVHNEELYFVYRDTSSRRMIAVFNLITPAWRIYDFTQPVTTTLYPSTVYSEDITPNNRLLLGTHTNGTAHAFDLAAVSDAGAPIYAHIRTGSLTQGKPRQDKLYGDVILDLSIGDDVDGAVSVVAYLNDATEALAALSVPSLVNNYPGDNVRMRRVIDPFGTEPRQARNVALDLSWISNVGASGFATQVYFGGPSFIEQPDTTIDRPTDWDVLGRLTDKYVKGILIECNTFGSNKSVIVEGDGVAVVTLQVSANGRRVLEFSFSQFKARLLRIRPTDPGSWIIYTVRWIYDEEPCSLRHWETQELDHGVSGYKTLLYAYITIYSTAVVTLTTTLYNHSTAGSLSSAVVETYTLPSTNSQKLQLFVPFNARKGMLIKYEFDSEESFHLYREESCVYLQVWGGDAFSVVHPFGNDDLDRVREMTDAQLAATREQANRDK